MALVTASMNHISPDMVQRPRYHANNTTKDVLELLSIEVDIEDGRHLAEPPSLDAEGFCLVSHHTSVSDFLHDNNAQAIYRQEIIELLKQKTGCDEVIVTSPFIVGIGEKSPLSGQFNNSHPARFLHVDINDETAQAFANRHMSFGKTIKRFAHLNIWRVITPPPQDVPLALCDARTVHRNDLIEAEAVFDEPNKPHWSFTGLILKYNPRHRWIYFSDMNTDEAIIFVTNDSDRQKPHCVPHGAFDNPLCNPTTAPRASVEIRATAYWYD